MKRIISLLLLTGILSYSVSNLQAKEEPITANNLSPVLKSIVEDVKKQCGLNPTQTTKFTNDYVTFLNENAKPGADTKKLLLQAGTSFRSYLNDVQFTKLTAMIQAGKLDPAKAGANGPVKVGSPQSYAEPEKLPLAVSVQSHLVSLFKQLSPYMNVTPDQSAKVIPILASYDQDLTALKTKAAGNNMQLGPQISALNGQTIPKLKAVLNDDQMAKLVLAASMQENILLGNNLSPDQRAFLGKLHTQYGMNDVQTMAVILVMVEGKVRGDAINQMAQTNPQGAAQELGKLLTDLDGQLKSALTADQYAKVKSDIEKIIKGQKL